MSTVPPVFSTRSTAPQLVARAAAHLTADLQSGLGRTHNYGYTGLAINSLRSNPSLVSRANQLLTAATQNVPPLNPVLGMETASSTLQSNQVIIRIVSHMKIRYSDL